VGDCGRRNHEAAAALGVGRLGKPVNGDEGVNAHDIFTKGVDDRHNLGRLGDGVGRVNPNPAYHINTYIFKVSVFTKQAVYE